MLPVLALFAGSLAIVFLTFWRPWLGRRFFRKLEKIFSEVAYSRWLPLGIVVGCIAVDFLLLLALKLPQPAVHDEFSYLLAGDTFAHGRLANPPHPLWKHFDTFYVLQNPTYVSKYPPGQALFLAVGQALWKPILGVWLSTALAAAAMFWMLAARLRKTWALAGALLTLTNMQVLFWNWRYWGGSVALLGGALVLGGFWRNLRQISARSSLVMGLGMGILSLSRPYEGAVFSAVLMGVTAYVCWRKKLASPFAGRIVFPIALVLLPFLGFQALYNYRTTGDPLLMPFVAYERAYNIKPLFLFQKDRAPAPQYTSPEIEKFFKAANDYFDQQRSLRGFFQLLGHKLALYKAYLWNFLFLLFLIPLAQLWPTRLEVRVSALLIGIMAVVAFSSHPAAFPHYYAAVLPVFVMLLCLGLRRVRSYRLAGRRFGLMAARSLFIYLCLTSAAIFVIRQSNHEHQWSFSRAALEARLKCDGQKHLVIVKYSAKHNPEHEWVYNGADLHTTPVIWARDFGDVENQKLLDFFKDRKVTIIEADALERPQ